MQPRRFGLECEEGMESMQTMGDCALRRQRSVARCKSRDRSIQLSSLARAGLQRSQMTAVGGRVGSRTKGSAAEEKSGQRQRRRRMKRMFQKTLQKTQNMRLTRGIWL